MEQGKNEASAPVYEWDEATIGDGVSEYDASVEKDAVGLYVRSTGDENPLYVDAGFARSKGLDDLGVPVSMTMRVAPTRRAVIMAQKGYAHPVRPTPFARWECRTFAPMRPGDVITSTSRLAEKFEKRGRKFVVWEIVGHNQRGEKVVEHRCTNMWEGAKPEDRSR